MVFRAIGDPTRRRILDRLRGGELSAGSLAAGFAVSRPAISRHLRLLRAAHLVRERREGRLRIYTLAPEPLAAVSDWLDGYRTFWAATLQQLKRVVEEDVDPRPSGARDP